MKDNKKRLFEVMGRLDKTFKPNLNEGFETIDVNSEEDVPAEISIEDPTSEEIPVEEPVEEKSPEEKLTELTAKVDELYALLHDEAEEAPIDDVSAEEPEEISVETGEIENLQEWNFDKKKGEKDEEKEEDEKEEKKEVDETEKIKKEKIPVAAVAKVGK